jgi:hypothetical protein
MCVVAVFICAIHTRTLPYVDFQRPWQLAKMWQIVTLLERLYSILYLALNLRYHFHSQEARMSESMKVTVKDPKRSEAWYKQFKSTAIENGTGKSPSHFIKCT